jgi:hypothetical protein
MAVSLPDDAGQSIEDILGLAGHKNSRVTRVLVPASDQ